MKGKNKILSAAIGYTVGNYLIKGLVFITLPIFTRLLSIKDYGIYNIYISYEGFFFHLIGLALHMSLKNAKIKWEKHTYLSYVSSMILLLIINLLVWLLVVIIFAPQLSLVLDLEVILLPILVIHSFLSSILGFYNVFLSLDYEYKVYISIGAVNACSSIILSIAFINCLYSEKYMGRILGTVFPLIAISIYIIRTLWKKSRPTINLKYWKYALTYSLPLIPHALSQVLLSQFDRIMINKMIGIVEAGIYSFAYNIYTIINITKSSLDTVWGPWFYEKMKVGEIETIKKKSSEYALGVALFVVIVIMIAPEIILILGTEEYADAVYVVIPLIVAGYFSFLYTLPAQVEYFYEKTSYIALSTSIAAIINILLNFYFISEYGYKAAAYTTEITYFVYFIFHYITATVIEKRELFSFKKLIFYGVGVGIIGLITVIIIDFSWLRWSFAAVLIVIFLKYLAKKIEIKKFIKRGKKKI